MRTDNELFLTYFLNGIVFNELPDIDVKIDTENLTTTQRRLLLADRNHLFLLQVLYSMAFSVK